MWNVQYSNRICNNQAKIREQIRHLESLISSKHIIDDTTPFKPEFLLLKASNSKRNEIQKCKIKEENKKHIETLKTIQHKSSIYNQRLLSPKSYPAFNKNTKFYNYDKKVKERKIKSENIVMKKRLKTITGEFNREDLINYQKKVKKYKSLMTNPNKLVDPSINFETPEVFIKKIRAHLLDNLNIEKKRAKTAKGNTDENIPKNS